MAWSPGLRERSELVGSALSTFRPYERPGRGDDAMRRTTVGTLQRSHSEISTPETLSGRWLEVVPAEKGHFRVTHPVNPRGAPRPNVILGPEGRRCRGEMMAWSAAHARVVAWRRDAWGAVTRGGASVQGRGGGGATEAQVTGWR